MAILRDEDSKAIAEIFGRGLQDPVTLRFFTQKASPLSAPTPQCGTCQETGEMLNEVTALSGKLKLETHDLVAEADLALKYRVDRIPAIVFEGKNKGTLRFFGVPAGYEFAVLIEDLVDLSRGATKLGEKTRRRLSEISGPVHIHVLVTPT